MVTESLKEQPKSLQFYFLLIMFENISSLKPREFLTGELSPFKGEM